MKINFDENTEDFIIVHRFLVLEEEISASAGSAHHYARSIICFRWPIGEATIAKSDTYRRAYEEFFGIKL